MKIAPKILFALLLPVSWVGAQRAVSVKMQAPPSSSYVIDNMVDINTQYLDYCAVPHRNGVMFTSARGGKRVFVCDQDLVTGRYSDLYFAKEDAEGRFFLPELVRGELNGRYHDGAPTFSRDGQSMIFSRNNGDGESSDGIIHLKTYSARLVGGRWEQMVELPINDDNYSTCHPTLTADGKTLFFASDRPGGYGGMDIYATKMHGETWSKPINLGSNVNSAGDEIFPFVTLTNNLYYSSNGRPGMGGLDIFSVLVSGMEASEPLHLQAPINSPYDDFAFTSDQSEFKGYLTSNRPGGKGQDDIYRWNFNGVRPVLASICVVDRATGTRITDANLQVSATETNGDSAMDFSANQVPGYQVLYPAASSAQEPVAKSCEVKVPVVRGEEYFVEVSRDGFQPVRLLVTSTEMLSQPEYLVPMEADKLLSVTGLVRSLATDLVLKDATVKVLNKCLDKVQEIKTDANGSFQFEVDCRCEYEVLAQKTGFEAQVKRWKIGEVNCAEGTAPFSMFLVPAGADVAESPIMEVGKVIKLESVYYDYNQFSIRTDAAADLDHVVALMKQYPTLEIELGSHTDARGSDTYNAWLSQERANAAVKYIISKGIAKRRLSARGYGEAQLVNGCTNGVECDDAIHEENRRTEIKITRLEEKGVRY